MLIPSLHLTHSLQVSSLTPATHPECDHSATTKAIPLPLARLSLLAPELEPRRKCAILRMGMEEFGYER
ncbi:hypothetical protein SAMN05216315_11375 [Nitrosospira sp. Nsp18]|nr:hypothetical protein SAMN05216315_11375 [Nitrosospira sp. Nsp18]